MLYRSVRYVIRILSNLRALVTINIKKDTHIQKEREREKGERETQRERDREREREGEGQRE